MLICACEINLTRIIPSKHLIFNIFGLPALPASVLINQSRLIRPLVSSVPNNKGNCQWNTVPYNKDSKTTVSEIIKPIWVARQPTQQQQCIYCEFVTYGELDVIAHVESSSFFANYLAKNYILFILFSVTKLQEHLLACTVSHLRDIIILLYPSQNSKLNFVLCPCMRVISRLGKNNHK